MKLKILILSLVTIVTLNAGDFIIKTSNNSVSGTVANIKKIVKSKGMGVFGIVNHQANAKKVGLKMPEAQVIIFGNPKLGTKIMQKDIRAALDLPIKILVYKSSNGSTKMEYLNPKALGKRYNLKGFPVLTKMSNALDAITTKAGM
jgi:uncharacterized protein (DUF302 family)